MDAVGEDDAIVVVNSVTGDEEVGALGRQLRGVIVRQQLPHLSHLGVRARQEKVPFVTCDDVKVVDAVVKEFSGQKVWLNAIVDNVRIEKYSGREASDIFGATYVESEIEGKEESSLPRPVAGRVLKVDKLEFIPLEAATLETCGAKAASCAALLSLAVDCENVLKERQNNAGDPLFRALRGVCLPFGCMESVLHQNQMKAIYEVLDQTQAAIMSGAAPDAEILDCLASNIIEGVTLPASFLTSLGAAFVRGGTVIVRSSSNVEDLDGMSGAGLYESVPNIDPRDPKALEKAILTVWASLHSRRALYARAASGVPPLHACMAVVIQEQVSPELSFVLHTTHPATGDAGTLVAEVAPGLGETLASGARGSAWRLEIEKESGKVRTMAFANFSRALMPKSDGRSVAPVTMDYSQQELSWDADRRTAVGQRLAAVGRLLGAEFGGAQDVEGCMVGSTCYVVQSRPQPLLLSRSCCHRIIFLNKARGIFFPRACCVLQHKGVTTYTFNNWLYRAF
jgi:phosphoglucan,water dikinase